MIEKSKRYTDTLWCICNDYNEYVQFAKELYLWRENDGFFGGEDFTYDDPWFEGNIGRWMDLFRVPYAKEDSDDEFSDEYEIDDPLTDTYEINEKPAKDEYPVLVHVQRIGNDTQIDWFNLPKLFKQEGDKQYNRIIELTQTVNQLKDMRDRLIGNVQQLENQIENMINKSDVRDILWNQKYDDSECIERISKLVGIKHEST